MVKEGVSCALGWKVAADCECQNSIHRCGAGERLRVAVQGPSSPGVGHCRWRWGPGRYDWFDWFSGVIGFLKGDTILLKNFSGFSWVVGNLSMLRTGHFFLKEHSSFLTRR